mmetsp:Transcript_13679/g.54815  ORF Transcript_13679/g.54815 Transcript_13679/m.54815 type:complete len:267 (-) Transcript_13679:884-1684(-)
MNDHRPVEVRDVDAHRDVVLVPQQRVVPVAGPDVAEVVRRVVDRDQLKRVGVEVDDVVIDLPQRHFDHRAHVDFGERRAVEGNAVDEERARFDGLFVVDQRALEVQRLGVVDGGVLEVGHVARIRRPPRRDLVRDHGVIIADAGRRLEGEQHVLRVVELVGQPGGVDDAGLGEHGRRDPIICPRRVALDHEVRPAARDEERKFEGARRVGDVDAVLGDELRVALAVGRRRHVDVGPIQRRRVREADPRPRARSYRDDGLLVAVDQN